MYPADYATCNRVRNCACDLATTDSTFQGSHNDRSRLTDTAQFDNTPNDCDHEYNIQWSTWLHHATECSRWTYTTV